MECNIAVCNQNDDGKCTEREFKLNNCAVRAKAYGWINKKPTHRDEINGMYIYKLNYSYVENGNRIYADYSLMHEERFAEDEFEKLCEDALNTISEKRLGVLKEYLKERHGFKEVKETAEFNFSK